MDDRCGGWWVVGYDEGKTFVFWDVGRRLVVVKNLKMREKCVS